ncbi:MAG: IcmT/TraK family protein [Alphaproteobacteria bacterium]|nr:IcmT/TraK family protein [Alphaproteobacteria bacterium]
MPELYWRDSQRTPRFFMFDAKASFGIIMFIFHARLWTFITAILIMIGFWLLERKGLNFTTALRVFRVFLIGNNRPKSSDLDKVSMKDYG